MGKRQISARELVADLRCGTCDEELMTKYSVSKSALDSLFNKLINAGLITQIDLDNRGAEIELNMDLKANAVPELNEPYYEKIFQDIERGKRRKLNFYAMFFGIFWYWHKGMWLKGFSYLLLFIALGIILESIIPNSGQAVALGSAGGLAANANWDYYLFKVHGERFFTRNSFCGKFPKDLPKKLI